MISNIQIARKDQVNNIKVVNCYSQFYPFPLRDLFYQYRMFHGRLEEIYQLNLLAKAHIFPALFQLC